MTEDAGAKNDIVQFGEEEQAEQMLQILNSEWIRGKVVNKYGLYEHYELFEDIEYRDTKLVKMWEDNVSFKRTEFQSIEIRVLDTDAQMAADIANDVASLVDSAKNKMIIPQSKDESVIANKFES